MLSPKRTKFRKAHKGRIHGVAKGGTQLNFGSYGLKAVTPERVTARQIEAARRAITPTCVVLDVFGSGFFLMYRFQANLQRFGWVKVRGHLNIG